MLMSKNFKCLALLAFWLLGTEAQAIDLAQNFNFDGVLLNDVTGVPLTGSPSLKFQIYDPTTSCLLFEETQVATLDGTGAFSVKIGAGTRQAVGVDGGLALAKIFQNDSLARTVSSPNCAPGYTPAAGDGRKLRVTVNGTVLTPDYTLGPVPMATVAESLQGKVATDFVSSIGASSATGPITMANNGELRLAENTVNGVDYVSLRAPAALAAPVSFFLPATLGSNGNCLTTDGAGAMIWAACGTGTVTNVSSASPYLSVVAATTTPTLTLNVGTTVNTVAAGNDARITGALQQAMAFAGDVSGVYSATSVDKIKGTGVAITTLGTGNFLRYNGTNWVNTMLSGSDVTTGLGYTALNKAGDTMSGLLVLSADPAVALGASTKQYVDASTSTAAVNYVRKDGTAAMIGALAMGGNSINGNSTPSGNLTLDSTSNATKGNVLLSPTGGNVGIGTTAPAGKLAINQPTAASIALQTENAGTAFWKVLNPGGGATNSWNAANAIEYIGKDTVTGRSINAAGTVNANGADFAEWVEWSGLKPQMGSVIQYRGSYVVVSSPFTAAFIGNDVRDSEHSILVAFAGQLPVLVRGLVHEGDLIIAGGDGTARAVPKAEATVADAQRAVGTAWASSNDSGLKRVHVAVGIGLMGGLRDIASLKNENEELKAEAKKAEAEREKLKQENAAIKARLDKIDSLLKSK